MMIKGTMLWILLLAVTAATVTAEDYEKYKRHQILRAFPKKQEHAELLRGLPRRFLEVKLWRESALYSHDDHDGFGTDIHIPPAYIKQIRAELQKKGIRFKLIAEDLQKFLKRHSPTVTDTENCDISFTAYNRLEPINTWIKSLKVPGKVIVESIGKSHEGRDLNIIKIGQTVGDYDSKTPVIWIDSGIHAREWIAPSVAVYVIDQLVKDVKNNGRLTNMFNWYILPVLNPDGYEYTWTKDRLWRKNRRPNPSKPICKGADLNRNFDFQWGTIGVSKNPCSDIYPGTSGASEPETKAVSKYIMRHKDNIKVFLTLHSYGQLWLSPWGYTKVPSPDIEDINKVGKAGIDAIRKVNGTVYRLGSSANILYQSSGTSRDWAKGVPKIKYVYTVELRDKGEHGFLLPPEYIKPTAEEFFASLKAVADEVKRIKEGW